MSFGSYAIEPIALEGIAPLDTTHFGFLLMALVVDQTPPPAAPTSIGQAFAVQAGETASAVVRPENTVPVVAAVDSLATVAEAGTPCGPTSVQPPPPFFFAGFDLILAAAVAAACLCAGAIVRAG